MSSHAPGASPSSGGVSIPLRMAVRRPGSVRVERQRRIRDDGAYGTTVRRRVVVAELPWTRTKYTPAERVVGMVRVSPRRVESGRSKSSRSIVGSCPCQAGRIGQEGEVVSVYAWGPVKSIRVHNWFCSKIQVVPPAITLPATWTRRQSREDEPKTFISGSDDSLNHPVRSNSSTWPLATYSTPSTAALRPQGALCNVDTWFH